MDVLVWIVADLIDSNGTSSGGSPKDASRADEGFEDRLQALSAELETNRVELERLRGIAELALSSSQILVKAASPDPASFPADSLGLLIFHSINIGATPPSYPTLESIRSTADLESRGSRALFAALLELSAAHELYSLNVDLTSRLRDQVHAHIADVYPFVDVSVHAGFAEGSDFPVSSVDLLRDIEFEGLASHLAIRAGVTIRELDRILRATQEASDELNARVGES